MKGTVYGGIAYLPKHPKADLHGLLRCVVRTQGMTNLTSALRVYDIPFSPVLFNQGIWAESKSVVEQQATEKNYGRVMVCSLQSEYLDVAQYELLPASWKLSMIELAPAPRVMVDGWHIGRHLFAPVVEEGERKGRCRVCHYPQDDPIHIRAVFLEDAALPPQAAKEETKNG